MNKIPNWAMQNCLKTKQTFVVFFLVLLINVKNRNLLIQPATKYKPKTPADIQVNQNRLLTALTFPLAENMSAITGSSSVESKYDKQNLHIPT